MRIANRIVSLLLIVLGISIMLEALTFDFFDDGIPGPGFMPFLTGFSITLVAIIPFVRTFTRFASKAENPFKLEEFKPLFVFIGSAIVLIIVTPFMGLVIPLGLMVGFTARIMGTKSWKTVIALTILTPTIAYILFVMILGVPLPKGILGF